MPSDIALFRFLNDLTGHSGTFDALVVFFATFYIFLILAVFAGFAYRDYHNKKQALYWYTFAVIAALIARFGVASIIRLFYHRLRPFIAFHLRHPLVTDTSYSFPSGHTIFLFALATGAFFVNKRLSHVLYASAFLVGFARVIAGVHYPSDILGGIILGIGTSLLLREIYLRVWPKKMPTD